MSELQALSFDIGLGASGSVCLRFVPDFMAKSELAGVTPRQFVIPALSSLVGDDPDELLLCPVRALQCYLELSASSRPGVQRLFVSLRAPTRAMSKNALAFFTRSVILDSFREVPDEVQRLTRVKAHEVRAVSSSLLFRKNRSLRDIQDAAIWRCNTTFVSCYLRDVAHRFLDVSSLGPVVAAGSVV